MKTTRQSKRYDSEDSKRRLLKAALDIFSREGYDAATTRAIAKKANVNDSLIQRYFGGKNGLLIALIQQFNQTIPNTPPLKFDSLEQEIEEFIRRKLAFARKHRKFLKIACSRAIVDPKVRDEVARFARSQTPLLTEELAKQRKLRRDLDLPLVSRYLSMVAASVGVFSEIIESLDTESAEAFIPIAARIFARGLADGHS